MNKKRRIIGIAAAILLAVVGTVSLVGYVSSAKDDAVAAEELVDVYVVERFVPKGADADTISESVVLEAIPARLRQDGVLTDLDGIGENVAATDLQPGDQLLAARLATKGGVIGEIDDKVQVSARLDAERAVGGALQKGDLVGVYLSFEPFDVISTFVVDSDGNPAPIVVPRAGDDEESPDTESTDTGTDGERQWLPEKSPNMTSMEFHHVLVTNVQTVDTPVRPVDDDDEDAEIEQVSGTQYVVTLALSPEESERFVFANEFGEVWLSIEPASVADDGTRIVDVGEVFDTDDAADDDSDDEAEADDDDDDSEGSE